MVYERFRVDYGENGGTRVQPYTELDPSITMLTAPPAANATPSAHGLATYGEVEDQIAVEVVPSASAWVVAALVAVLLCPVVSMLMGRAGVDCLAVALPRPASHTPDVANSPDISGRHDRRPDAGATGSATTAPAVDVSAARGVTLRAGERGGTRRW